MMTRYERVSSDCLPLSNGKKSHITENGRSISHSITTTTITSLETKFKSSSSRSQYHNHNCNCSPSHSDHASTSRGVGGSSSCGGVNGDVFLQWGLKKRARVSRSEIRALADESSSSIQAKHKIPRRADATSKLSTPPMPPPLPPPPHANGGCKGGSFKKETSSFLSNRVLEKRSGAGNVSPLRNSGSGGGGSSRIVSRSTSGKRSPTPEKVDKKLPNNPKLSKYDKSNGSSVQHTDHLDPTNSVSKSEHEAVVNINHATTMTTTSIMASVGEKLTVEWPRIYLALSRKEKEDDFFAMKGTKLPQRPKKRPKNIDKALQYCFPGMWLSDLTKSRYEVREKKCVKKQPKQRRGLKGMESVESDTE